MWTPEDAAAAAADGWQISGYCINPKGNKFPSRGAALQHVQDLARHEKYKYLPSGGMQSTGEQGIGCRALKHIDDLKVEAGLKQFPDVSSAFGAPMGRWEGGNPLEAPCRLFKVKLVDGAYDDGGAYWGHPDDLYCLQRKEDDETQEVQHFMRAGSRIKAFIKFRLQFPGLKLYIPVNKILLAEYDKEIALGLRERDGERKITAR